MKIKVTKEDIAFGQVKVCTACPVARALLRETEKIWKVNKFCAFSSDTTPIEYLSYTNSDIIVGFPIEVTEFIRNFDSYKTVEPFEFDFLWEPKK